MKKVKVVKKTTTVTEEVVVSTPEIAVAILLDESGSMAPTIHDTIGAVNAYFAKLKQDDKTRELIVTLRTFKNSALYSKTLYKGVRVKDMPEQALSKQNYTPGGGTPLYDAMGSLIEELRAEGHEKVLFTIVSDGQENTSAKYNREHIADKIKATGWEFNFLGANFDAYAETQRLGIAPGHTVNYTMDNMSATMDSMAASTKRFTQSGGLVGASAYTLEEKMLSGDKTGK